MTYEEFMTYEKLEAQLEERGIETSTPVYQLSIEDVLCVLADEGLLPLLHTVEEVMSVVEYVRRRLEIDWVEPVQRTAEAFPLLAERIAQREPDTD